MKILHITNNYPTAKFPISGIFVKEQIESLQELNLNVSVYLINGREKGKKEYLKQIFLIRKFLQKNKFDVIHCHHALTAICLIMSGRSKNNKIVVSFQNDPTNEYGLMLYHFIQKRAKALIFKNNSGLINSSQHHYLPNGVNMSFFRSLNREEACNKLKLNISKRYILFVSSNFMRKQKRYDIFCKVIRIVKDKYGIKDIEELKLINTKRELVPYYFNACSLHLLTSDFEGSPNSVKEAMACETPVVSSNVGNVAELLDNVDGSYVSLENTPEHLASLVIKSLKYRRNNSREILIRKGLNKESVAQNLINIYHSITE